MPAEITRRRLKLPSPLSSVGAVVAGMAILYSFLAGLRTVGDPDLGWQLATGRWILQHHAIPGVDVLSHTAAGQTWIYPVLSPLLFCVAYTIGGYSLLSWLTAIVCCSTAFILARGSVATRCLALIAVPLIAERCSTRAELFTEILFAVFTVVLLRYQRRQGGRLWLLPVLMVFWVNLHPGYVLGLAICAGYVFLEVGELVSESRRKFALVRLRGAALPLLAILPATLLNPWGYRNFIGMSSLLPIQSSHWNVELLPIRLTTATAADFFAWREASSAFWWLAAAVLLAVILALLRKRIAPALLLAATLIIVFHAQRFVGPFATLAIVAGGEELGSGLAWLKERVWRKAEVRSTLPSQPTMMLCVLMVLSAFTGLRCWDLVNDRFYRVTAYRMADFGVGVSWWYPEEAARFVKQQQLPAQIYNQYTAGGFTAWRLGPEYGDYVDGRGNPFGDALLLHGIDLDAQPLDSPQWQEEPQLHGVHTVFLSLNPEAGNALWELQKDCHSSEWTPVYLDAKSAIFVHNDDVTRQLRQRLAIHCENVHFELAPKFDGWLTSVHAFRYHLNAAAVLTVLGEDSAAGEQLQLASGINTDSAFLHTLRGVLAQRAGRPEESAREWTISLKISPSDLTAILLAQLFESEGQLPQAAKVIYRQAELSPLPAELYLRLSTLQLRMNQPRQALDSLTKAESSSPYNTLSAYPAREFAASIAERRAEAFRAMGKLPDAIAQGERASSLFPNKAEYWQALSDDYAAAGDTARAAVAAAKAQALNNPPTTPQRDAR